MYKNKRVVKSDQLLEVEQNKKQRCIALLPASLSLLPHWKTVLIKTLH